MKKILFSMLVAVFGVAGTAFAQNDIWTDSFFNGVPATTGQITGWDNWRASLKPGSYTFMTIKGTYDQVGITCTDKTIVNAFATAVQNYATYISPTTGGHVWSICNRYLGEIWLDPPSSCSGANCPNGYIIRPGIGTGNQNWGGVNTNTCGGPNQRMTFIFGKPSKPNDMGMDGIAGLEICSSVQDIIGRFTNYGTNTVDSFRVYWEVNGSPQTPLYVTSSLISSRDTTFPIQKNFNFTNNTNYTFKFWTHRPNSQFDSVASNDTFTYKLAFLGNPDPPATTDFKQCGNGKPMLTATPGVNSDSILWFDQSSGGKLLGIGRTIEGPYITATRTFYAQAMKFGGSSVFGSGYAGTTIVSGDLSSNNGTMFDVTVTNSVVVENITIELWNNTGNSGYAVYMKTGTYLGNETNPSAWTQIASGSANPVTSGNGNLITIPLDNLLLQGSTTYGFYYTTDVGNGAGNDVYLHNGTAAGSNGDISINGGRAIWGNFGSNGVYATWTGNFEFGLTKQCSNPSRTALTVTVKPRPVGADVVKGTPFDGQFRAGVPSTPDVSEVGKTIVYELAPPTGYTNANHGTAWTITNLEARDQDGILIPDTDYDVVPPSTTGPGTIEFTPKTVHLDKFITFSVQFMDLGPHLCDSTIKRTVVVAPTPEPDFRLPASICVGDPIFFDNVSNIYSGNMTYVWYFGDGDTSDLVSPVHEYKNPGTHDVRLIATSFPWGTIKDTTIRIEVGELPDVKFKVNNACEGLAVSFQNQTTVGTGTLSYEWEFGDNSPTTTTTNPTHLYGTPGGYKVTLTADANGCVSKLVKNAYTFARPDADFAVPLAPVCAKSEIVIPNTSTIALGNQGAFWRFGDGSSSTQYHAKHSYLAPGTYDIRLLAVSEFDCRDSVTKQITIKATPNPDFSGDLFCSKRPTVFTNTTNEVVPNPVYNWTFSDGFNSNLKNVTKQWPFEGPFTATLQATYSNGCTDKITKRFTVLKQPEAIFEVDDICSGENAIFANRTFAEQDGIIYDWSFGDGVNSTDINPIKLYAPNTTTTYTVSLVAAYTDGCSDTTSKTLTVSESPICDFNVDDLGFLNTKFTPSNTGYSEYTWTFGEGGSSTDVSPTYKYTYTGSFNVTMRAINAAGCDCEITKRIYANTGIDEFTIDQAINIYPNPNSGNFSVSNANGNAMTVEVFNVLGVNVYTNSSDNGTVSVQLEGASAGIYMVKVTINGVSGIYKVTVN